jgi:cytochrome c-type biogenesis protein CcmH
MSTLPPWTMLFLALLLLGGVVAWVVQRGLKPQAHHSAESVVPEDLQWQTHRRIQQQHLTDLDTSLAEGRLNAQQHTAARDELLRHLLADAAHANTAAPAAPAFSWGWLVVVLIVLTGLSYWQLGASQTWWPLPLSQRVQISATTTEQLTEQTRQWQEATHQRPNDALAWLTLARLHAAQNAHLQAEQALAKVLALSPEPDLWIERAQMKALGAGGVYAGEPWQWIQNVLRAQPQHLNALVLAGSAALSEQRHAAAQSYWQQALALVPAESEAAQSLQQALAQSADKEQPKAQSQSLDRPLIQGEVRVSAQVQSQLGLGATLFVYAMAEEGTRRPVAIWRGTPTAWPVAFVLRDSMGMGASPLLSDLPQVKLVARISKTGTAQRQPDDWQVELSGVKTGVQGVVLNISAR